MVSGLSRLPAVAGCDFDDVDAMDMIERVHTHLDEADKLFAEGSRAGGMYALGKAASLLEAFAAPLTEHGV